MFPLTEPIFPEPGTLELIPGAFPKPDGYVKLSPLWIGPENLVLLIWKFSVIFD